MFAGGMKAVTWTQVVQGIILIVAYLVPVTWLSLRATGVPLPQLMSMGALLSVSKRSLLWARAEIMTSYWRTRATASKST